MWLVDPRPAHWLKKILTHRFNAKRPLRFEQGGRKIHGA
jgi:hypothetical protein